MDNLIGQRIKERRLIQKITMAELAEQVGYNAENKKSNIYHIEAGKSRVPIERLPMLSNALHTSIYYLLGVISDPEITDDDIKMLISSRDDA